MVILRGLENCPESLAEEFEVSEGDHNELLREEV